MTAALVVTLGGRQVEKVLIDKDVFVIGRSQRSDLRLDDKNVSREHAVITRRNERFYIQDRGSRNNTLVNGTAITKQVAIKEEDRIGLGPYELVFLVAGSARDRQDDDSRTRFMSGSAPDSKPRPPERKLGRSALRYGLEAVEGPLKGHTWRDWSGELTIGRNQDSTVTVPDDAASGAHARITQEEGVFSVEDLQSSNGTFVDGVRVQKSRIRNNAKIRVGVSTFVFTVSDPEKHKFRLALTAAAVLFIITLSAVVVLLLPDDNLAPVIQQGDRLLRSGNFRGAKEQYERALRMKPGDEMAKKQLALAVDLIKRDETLAKARDAAEKEQYDTALEICAQLLRQSPQYKAAKELEAVIGLVRDAQSAIDARNWEDAIRLLTKARESYPSSSLLSSRLERAKSEISARKSLARAKEFMAAGQADKAQEELLGIPQSSIYYVEARGMTQGIKRADATSGNIEAARLAYRQGNVTDAMAAVADGLKLSPGNAELAAIKRHIDGITPLADETARGRDLRQSDDISAIRAMTNTCAKLIKLEPDSGNRFRKDASILAGELETRLGELESDAIAKAKAALSDGNKKEAHRLYTIALAANPANRKAAEAAEQIASEISADCRKYYQQGLVHEELGQNDQAIAAYEKTLDLAIENDSYYQRAKDKLGRMKK